MKRVCVAAALALCATLAAGCGGQGTGRLAQVQAGPMPQGATFRGVWYNPSWGELHLVPSGDEVVGRWRSAQRGLWGQMTGTVNGDVIRFRWEERKVGGIDPGSVRKGRGYFKYVPVEAPDLPRLRGEWGLGDNETGGGEWDSIKQKDVEPRIESIGNDPDPTLENWDRPKASEDGGLGSVSTTGGPGPRVRGTIMPAQASQGLQFVEPTIFERGAPGRSAVSLPELDVPAVDPAAHFGAAARREAAGLPEVSEPEVVRHYVRTSQWNFCIDSNFYPLGSCTMKFNPKVNEWAARLPGFAGLHPLTPAAESQGALELIWRLERLLAEIVGLSGVSLQPAAGAQGELTGLMMMRAYHQSRGRSPRKVIIPDTAHGTNPASCTANGLVAVPVVSGARGVVELAEVARAVEQAGDDLCGVMMTNPNTLGLYEVHMPAIARLVHERGGLVYGDGANMNAVLGRSRPGDVGVDVLQFNLHKTFTTPHGGGGPGSGPVAFVERLEPFQPGPTIARAEDGSFRLDHDRPQSVGRVRSFLGNFGMMVRAYTYIRELGAQGLRDVSAMAVLNANYLATRLEPLLPIAYPRPCMHEAVFSDRELEAKTGVKTLDLAKRLIDYGFHPPTVYFPLNVKGAMMIEPTETESKEALDAFTDAVAAILREAVETPEKVTAAPHTTRVSRLDEARAARKPQLRWRRDAS